MGLFSMLGIWFESILFSALNLVAELIYYIFIGITHILDFVEKLFERLAGVGTTVLNAAKSGVNPVEGSGGSNKVGEYEKDLVYNFITNNDVRNAFISILAVSIILLIIFTIIALIKSEFHLSYAKDQTKSAILGRSLKSLINFLVIPVIFLVSVVGVNVLTAVVKNIPFSKGSTSFMEMCFDLAAKNANRIRSDKKFYNYLIASVKEGNSDAQIAAFRPPGTGSQNQFVLDWLSGEATTDPDTHQSNFADALDRALKKNGGYYDEKGYQIYELFRKAGSNYTYLNKQSENQMKSNYKNGTYAATCTCGVGYPEEPTSDGGKKVSPIWDFKLVNYFYDLFSFDYVTGYGAPIIMVWNMLGVCMLLIKRALELVIIFLLSPVASSVAPIKGEQPIKYVQSEFAKRLLSIIGPIFAYNVFFTLFPLLEEISPFDVKVPVLSTVYNALFHVICLIVGLSMLKDASKLFSNMLGIEDLVSNSSGMMNKAIGVAGKLGAGALVGGALRLGGMAVKGSAALLKKGGKFVGRSVKKGAAWVGQTKVGQSIKNVAGRAGGAIKNVAGWAGEAIKTKAGGVYKKMGDWDVNRKKAKIAKKFNKKTKGRYEDWNLGSSEDIQQQLDQLKAREEQGGLPEDKLQLIQAAQEELGALKGKVKNAENPFSGIKKVGKAVGTAGGKAAGWIKNNVGRKGIRSMRDLSNKTISGTGMQRVSKWLAGISGGGVSQLFGFAQHSIENAAKKVTRSTELEKQLSKLAVGLAVKKTNNQGLMDKYESLQSKLNMPGISEGERGKINREIKKMMSQISVEIPGSEPEKFDLHNEKVYQVLTQALREKKKRESESALLQKLVDELKAIEKNGEEKEK